MTINTRRQAKHRNPCWSADWIYRRGDIYLANLNPFTGSEQGGRRPVLVLQNNDGNFYCPTLIVAPLTSRFDSFEEWYAGQIRYRKVSGVSPGENLRKESYSARDIAEILGLSESHVYDLIIQLNQAVKWELMERNPATLATVPKYKAEKREIWTAETLFHAIEVCEDDRLKLAIHLAFSCSLRIGEIKDCGV